MKTNLFLLSIFALIILVGLNTCKKDETIGQVPTIVNQLTTNLTATSITINVLVNPNLLSTTVAFEYGTSSNYNDLVTAQDPLTGDSSILVSINIGGLSQNTIYYARAYATNSMGITYGDEIIFKTSNVDVGEYYQGGIVAYILQEGDLGYNSLLTHGLIAAPYDLKDARWGCYGTAINGADGSAIGTGLQNTIDIINSCTEANIAAKLCYDLVLNGYDDWYLPSKGEFNLLVLNEKLIGNLDHESHVSYWSSTEYSSVWAWEYKFRYGSWNTSTPNEFYKSTFYHVRAIRSF